MQSSRAFSLRALRNFMTVQPVLRSTMKFPSEHVQHEQTREEIEFIKSNKSEQMNNNSNNNINFTRSKLDLNDIQLAARRANALRHIKERKANKMQNCNTTTTTNKNKNNQEKLTNNYTCNENECKDAYFQMEEDMEDALDAAVSFGKTALFIQRAHEQPFYISTNSIKNNNNNNNNKKNNNNNNNKNEYDANTNLETFITKTIEQEGKQSQAENTASLSTLQQTQSFINLHAKELLENTLNEWNNSSKEEKFDWVWASPQGRHALREFVSRQLLCSTTPETLENCNVEENSNINYTDCNNTNDNNIENGKLNCIANTQQEVTNQRFDSTNDNPHLLEKELQKASKFTLPPSRHEQQQQQQELLQEQHNLHHYCYNNHLKRKNRQLAREHLSSRCKRWHITPVTNSNKWKEQNSKRSIWSNLLDNYHVTTITNNNKNINSNDSSNAHDEMEMRLHTKLLTRKVRNAQTKRQRHLWRQLLQDMLGLHGGLVFTTEIKTLQEPNISEMENEEEISTMYSEELQEEDELYNINNNNNNNKLMKRRIEDHVNINKSNGSDAACIHKCKTNEYADSRVDKETKTLSEELELEEEQEKGRSSEERTNNKNNNSSNTTKTTTLHETLQKLEKRKEFARLCESLHVHQSPRKVYVMQRLLPILREYEDSDRKISLQEVSRLAQSFSEQYNKELETLKCQNKCTDQVEQDINNNNITDDRNNNENNKERTCNERDVVQEFKDKLIESEMNKIDEKLQTFQRHVPLLQRTLQVIMRSTRPYPYPHSHTSESEFSERNSNITQKK